MLHVFTLIASLLALCHGLTIPDNLNGWLKDAVPLKSAHSTGSRIVGGEKTAIENHPFTVSLQHEWEPYQYDTIHFCTGGILNEDWIVTSAHCALLLEVVNVTARVGSNYFHQDGTVYEIQKVVFHPLFDVNVDDYDIALLMLNQSLSFSDTIQPITLPAIGQTVVEDLIYTMASWGASNYMGDMNIEIREISMPTISKELCSTVWANRLTDRMFCGYKESEGICVGDTGTPAVINGVLRGIASFTYACSAYGYPAVYTDVSTVLDWITEISGALPGSGSPLGPTFSLYSLLAIAVVLAKIRLE